MFWDIIRELVDLSWFRARLLVFRRIKLRGVTIVFDRRGVPGKWSRYTAIQCQELILRRRFRKYALSGSGQLIVDDWSDGMYGFSQHQKIDQPFKISVVFRPSFGDFLGPSFDILENGSVGVDLGSGSVETIYWYFRNGERG